MKWACSKDNKSKKVFEKFFDEILNSDLVKGVKPRFLTIGATIMCVPKKLEFWVTDTHPCQSQQDMFKL